MEECSAVPAFVYHQYSGNFTACYLHGQDTYMQLRWHQALKVYYTATGWLHLNAPNLKTDVRDTGYLELDVKGKRDGEGKGRGFNLGDTAVTFTICTTYRSLLAVWAQWWLHNVILPYNVYILFRSCHKAIMVITGRAHCYPLEILLYMNRLHTLIMHFLTSLVAQV